MKARPQLRGQDEGALLCPMQTLCRPPDNVKLSQVLHFSHPPPPHAEARWGTSVLSGACGPMSAGACS